jgi:DUF917 family protein
MAVGNETEYARLRRDVGASIDVLPDLVAEEYFVEAQEVYPTNSAKMKAYTRVIAIKGIRASAALLGKYAQNQHSEDLTKVFDNLTTMLRDEEAKVGQVTDVIASTEGSFFFGVAPGRRFEPWLP